VSADFADCYNEGVLWEFDAAMRAHIDERAERIAERLPSIPVELVDRRHVIRARRAFTDIYYEEGDEGGSWTLRAAWAALLTAEWALSLLLNALSRPQRRLELFRRREDAGLDPSGRKAFTIGHAEPPGRVVTASPHCSNAPPLPLDAPCSAGEREMAA
jgi:hypothetical protein